MPSFSSLENADVEYLGKKQNLNTKTLKFLSTLLA